MLEPFNTQEYLSERKRIWDLVTHSIVIVPDPDAPGFHETINDLDYLFVEWSITARKLPPELVRSRRAKAPTKRYLELMKKYKQQKDELDAEISMFLLKYRH